MSRESFASELSNIIQESGIRKSIIAQAVGLSSSALSQFVHGTALPRQTQLGSLLALLCVPAAKRVAMFRLLNDAKIEFESQGLPYTIDDEEIPAEEEDPQQENKDHLNFNELFSANDGSDDIKNVLFAEQPDSGIPIIDIYALDELEYGMDLYDFAMLNLHDTTIRDYGSFGSPVIVKTTGDLVGLKYPGMIQLVISQEIPTEASAITLEAYADKTYRLIFREEEGAFESLKELLYDDDVSKKRKKWHATVLEFSIMPLCSDSIFTEANL